MHVEIDVCKFLIPEGWFEVARRSKKKVFTVVAENDVGRGVPFIGNRSLFLVGDGINVNPGKIVLFRAGPRNPLAVGRPIVRLNLTPFILIYFSDRFCRYIDIAQPLQAIGPKEFLTIG